MKTGMLLLIMITWVEFILWRFLLFLNFFTSIGEANKQLGDYKFKLQKAEQDVSTLQASVSAF